jgi:murein DD-endopeptidase MepM/ murein hydrolase activator NlpD
LDYSPGENAARFAARRSFLIAALVLVMMGAAMSRTGGAMRAANPESAAVAAPVAAAAETAPVTVQTVTTASSPWITVTVKRGQTLSQIFDRENLSPHDWIQVLALGGDTRRLLKLKAGERIQLRKGPEGLQELSYALDEMRTLQVVRTGTGFDVMTLAADVERRPTYATGNVTSSLWNACQGAGLNESTCVELADVFGYDIDFGRDIRVGDHFSVIYEDLYKDGKRLREDGILAAEFVNQGQAYRAVRYTDPQGKTGYYGADGQSLRKAFTKAPLDVVRITSGFSYARFHPILHTMRAHRGVDYGAPTGTPVKATGDGRVAFEGIKGGYGKVIMLKHGSSYETVYGHLSRFRPGLGVGSHVQQGQVIAYVGATGLATAPHLHYEFRVNGVHKDPRKVILPRAGALPRQYLENFRASSRPLLQQLEQIAPARIAQASLH